MLHSFMITSGRGGIVLFRKTLTKVLNQPRLIAGLVTALCDFSVGSSIHLPVSTIDLDNFSVSIVQLPADETDANAERNILRIVLFHDSSDGDVYGHVLGLQLLTAFREAFGDRLRTGALGHTDGVENIFKAFSTQIRPAVTGSVRPLMELLESHSGIKSAFLIRHRADGGYANALTSIWYAPQGTAAETVVADVQALLDAADDVMAAQRDQTTVVTLGPCVRIERLGPATLVVTAQPPATCMSCQRAIDGCTDVLKQLFVLMRGLEGSRGILS